MVDYSVLTQADLDKMIEGAGALGFAAGLIFGILIFAVFWYFINNINRKNFKMWFLQLAEKERRDVEDNLDALGKTLEELSKSNTKLFKSKFNELNELKAYIKKKWMQS